MCGDGGFMVGYYDVDFEYESLGVFRGLLCCGVEVVGVRSRRSI